MNRRDAAILLGVYATFALDVFSTFTSSPQTTELNAAARADTLMKWVKIGALFAVAGGVIGSSVQRSYVPLLAAGGVTLLMVGIYTHAKQSGLEAGGEPTESY